jgi:hypothetical protein
LADGGEAMRRDNRILLLAMLGLFLAAGPRCGSDDGTGPVEAHMEITPDSAVVELCASQQFQVLADGETPAVKWFVGPDRGGTPALGMIDGSGLYTAPYTVPEDSVVIIKAVAEDDAALTATATAVIRGGSGIPLIEVIPADTSLSPGESIMLAKQATGCGTGEVSWSVEALWGSSWDVGSIGADGSYTVPGDIGNGITALFVRAAGEACPSRSGIARIAIAYPVEFKVEIEDYVDSHDDEEGSMYIVAAACSQASGGAMVRGLDYPGEWVEIPFTVPAYGTYEVTLRYAALKGDSLEAAVTFPGCGSGSSDPEVDFIMDQGAGLG